MCIRKQQRTDTFAKICNRAAPCLLASCHNILAVLTARGPCMCMLTTSVVPSGKHVHIDFGCYARRQGGSVYAC